MGWVADQIIKVGKELVDTGVNAVDTFVTTGDEKRDHELKVREADLRDRELELEFQTLGQEIENKFFEDQQSARDMQSNTNSKIPGALTIIFTIAYFAITAFMMVFLLDKIEAELSQFVVVFISSIFGSFNAIMVQIVSFYFGSSKGGEDQGAKMVDAFNSANKKED